jgi:hypothetical protein
MREAMTSKIHERLLSPEGMLVGRAAVVERYEWFIHATPLCKFPSIQATGLEPRQPEASHPIAEVLAARENGQKIVCLSPHPRRHPLLLNKGEGVRLFKVAVHRDDLPASVGVDWSFGGTTELAADLAEGNDKLAEIFLRVIEDREVILSYEPIPASALRVFPKANPALPPSEWPMLMDTELADVAELKPDLVGNVAV